MGEEKEEGGAIEVGGATVADVRQAPRQAVEAENPSRAKGGRARAIGCVANAGESPMSSMVVHAGSWPRGLVVG